MALTPLIQETMEEIIAEGDPASADEARRYLRYAQAVAIHRQQLAATDEHCRTVQAFNASVRSTARISYAT